MNRSIDQVYEYLSHLDYQTIRHLCQTDKYYYNLCKTERFQKLIKQKLHEMLSQP